MLLEHLRFLLAEEVIELRLECGVLRQILRMRRRIGVDAEQGQLAGRCGTGKDAMQAIIVPRGNRVVFVIVTASATNRQRHRAACDDIDPVVDRVVHVLELPAQGQEPKPGQRSFVPAKVQLIRSHLLEQELIVGQVVVERADHVIPISEGIGTVGAGIAGHIQPVTAPTFAIVLRVEQAIHDCCEGVRGLVRHEGGYFLRCRRQADQIISRPPDQGSFIRW